MPLGLLGNLSAWAHAARAASRDRRDVKHEPETPFIAALLSHDDICLHVGASEGRHTRAMAAAAPDGRIFCFEPNGHSFAALRHFLRIQRITNAEAIHAAVSNDTADVFLNVPIKTTGRMARSLGVIGSEVTRGEVLQKGFRRERVPAIVLDRFAEERKLRSVDFIRMDIEGAEALALPGAKQILDAYRPNLLIELHPVSLSENFGADVDAIVHSLLDRGYRMFAIGADGALAEYRSYADDGPWKDYFFVHPDRLGRLPAGVFRELMSQPPRTSGTTLQ